tara:strand:- start:2338 stop:2910 length:573 start_codon:yes stop_codon:yes gene_type:complete
MNRILFIILYILLYLNSFSQSCVNSQNGSIQPVGPYQPGDIVTVTYNLTSWTQVNINWVHAFELNLGPGWDANSIIPSGPPGNPFGSTGYWVWDNQHTFVSGLNFGPGWRFVNTSIPAWGTMSTGPFSMSFILTVGQTCNPEDLSVNVTVYGDCQTGGWWNGGCCNDPPYNIYQGNVLIVPVVTSNINHY